MDMFEEAVREWLREKEARGEMQDLDGEARARLARDYVRQLEAFFNEEVMKQLTPAGKAAEYERMLLYDGQYMNKYLNQTIAGYPAYRTEVFARAKKAILGE